ncbi:MAG: histidinol-phosphatase HisJ family protein [Clostridiaceae bacterium]|jgi:histidinol-phosphatase (PHP family)|nr:histidinol-phosphatase HisJ family protein [Clostridiaceae bacterium]
MFDTHIHSLFSTDSVMDADQACGSAIKLGLEGIAFTDHLDYDFPGEIDFLIDFDEYFSVMDGIREKYKDRMKVIRAVEVGIQPHVLQKSEELIRKYPFDYVLASIHIVGGQNPYDSEYYSGKTKKEAYTRYLEEIYYMVRNLESFDMLGHFGYIVRNANYDDRTLRYTDYSDLFDMIFKKLIEHGRGFELNTGTYRAERPDVVYDAEILKRYRQLGGELICLGSDAHQADHIAARFGHFAQLLRDAGFKYTVHFENRKPVFDKL